MPSAGSAFRRGGSGAGQAEAIIAPVRRRWRKVEAFAVTTATIICALAIGFTVVTLYQLGDESQSTADARQPANAVLTPTSGSVGTSVLVRGTNFPRYASIVFSWDGATTGMAALGALAVLAASGATFYGVERGLRLLGFGEIGSC